MSESGDVLVPSDSISEKYSTRSTQCHLEEFNFDESSLVIKLCLLGGTSSDDASAETVSSFFFLLFDFPHRKTD